MIHHIRKSIDGINVSFNSIRIDHIFEDDIHYPVARERKSSIGW